METFVFITLNVYDGIWQQHTYINPIWCMDWFCVCFFFLLFFLSFECCICYYNEAERVLYNTSYDMSEHNGTYHKIIMLQISIILMMRDGPRTVGETKQTVHNIDLWFTYAAVVCYFIRCSFRHKFVIYQFLYEINSVSDRSKCDSHDYVRLYVCTFVRSYVRTSVRLYVRPIPMTSWPLGQHEM